MELSLPLKIQPLLNIHKARLGVRIGAGLHRYAIDDVIVHRPDYTRLWLDVEDVKKVVHWLPDVEFIHG